MKTIGMFFALSFATLAAGAFEVEQVFRPERFVRGDTNVRKQQEIDEASWIWLEGLDVWGAAIFTETRPKGLETVPSYFVKFRKDFDAVVGEPLEIDVSADERYVLLLDGKEISRGPHRGLANRWHYQSYHIGGLEPGAHRLEAVCWQLGEHAPLAQVTLRGGFILKASGRYDAALTTGKAEWMVGRLTNTRMTKKASMRMFGVGSCCEVKGTSFLDEEPSDWSVAKTVRGPCTKVYAGLVAQGWMLFPTVLHDMMFERKTPGRIVRGTDVLKPGTVIPAHTKTEAIWDLGDYYCGYPFLRTSGGAGAKVTWTWTECLTDEKGKKGDRSAWEGLDVHDIGGDEFRPDGRADALFTTPWWRCGKWCKITVETADEPLTIGKVEFAETRSPLKLEATFECDDPFVMAIQPLCARSLEVCMHEHFFDCPHYEQQMYPGDGRLHFQTAGLFDPEDRLVRNALTLYDFDRRDSGMISMNCPTRGTQDGFGFAECEVFMFRDYMMNHTNRKWFEARLPGMNHTLMGFAACEREDGLLGATPGWNFVDWVPRWNGGVPPDGDGPNPNAELNLQYLNAILSAAASEKAVGHDHLAAHWTDKAEKLKAAIKRVFWCPERSLFASTAAHKDFSEHAQCLALLCDVVTGDEAAACFKALVDTSDLDRGTIYYKHYLFETFFKFERGDLFFANLGFWKDCRKWGLSTILETPTIDSRSDCHGWGAHPLWHLHTGVAGVRSAAPWYEKVLVAPQPGHLKFIKSSTPTPKGAVELDLRFDDGTVSGSVTLPEGLPGEFSWYGSRTVLHPGTNEIIRAAFGKACFESALPVWPQDEEKTMNSFFRFRSEFEAKDGAKAMLRITAGYDYKAWLNGNFVAFGPARTAPGFFRVDEWPLTAKPGQNVVEIDVAGYNCNNFYLPDQTPFLQAEVVVDGKVVAKTAADGDFAALTTGRVRKVPRFSYQRTFAEIYCLPHAASAVPSLAEQPAKKLLPREWDKPDFHVVDGFRAVSSEKVVRDTDAKVQSDRYIVSKQANYKYFKVDELEENPYHDIQRLKTVSRSAAPEAKDGWYPISENEGIVFSGTNEEAGFPMLKVRCESPVTIYFTFDELLQDDGSVNPFRAQTLGTLVWHLEKGEHALEGFEPIAFKCARVLAVGGAAEVKSPAIRTYASPSADRTSFKSSDPALEKIFNAARRSYAANAVDCLTDCPIRERAGWLGDTFFTGRASKWLTGSARNEELFLDNFQLPADYGSEPKFRGLVPAVWPVDLMTDDCFIPNYDFWFVLELEEFLARGGDPALVRSFRPKVLEIVGWFGRHLNSDGLLEKLPGWVFVEWSKANDLVQDVSYPSNMMYAKMLDAIARLYAMPNLAAQAAKIRETVRRQSLTADGWYCDNAVRRKDGTLKLSGERTEICQYYAFFTGVADKERDALLWKRLVEDFGPERIRKGVWKDIWPANFIFGTCLRLELLSRDGRAAQIYSEIRDYFLQMAEKTGTLWEHNDPRASCCHGFASIAAEYLFRDVLGIRAIDRTAKTIRVDPAADLQLDWCEGTVPVSPDALLTVKWRKSEGKPVVEVKLPDGWQRI